MQPTFQEMKIFSTETGHLKAVLLQYFLAHVLFGQHVLMASGILSEEVEKTVDAVQNTHHNCQVKHQQKKNSWL